MSPKGLMLNEQEHFKDKIKELPVSFIPLDIILPYALQKMVQTELLVCNEYVPVF